MSDAWEKIPVISLGWLVDSQNKELDEADYLYRQPGGRRGDSQAEGKKWKKWKKADTKKELNSGVRVRYR